MGCILCPIQLLKFLGMYVQLKATLCDGTQTQKNMHIKCVFMRHVIEFAPSAETITYIIAAFPGMLVREINLATVVCKSIHNSVQHQH